MKIWKKREIMKNEKNSSEIYNNYFHTATNPAGTAVRATRIPRVDFLKTKTAITTFFFAQIVEFL